MLDATPASQQPTHDPHQTRVLFWIAACAAVGASAVYGYSLYANLNTTWDFYGVPVLIAAFAGSAVALHWWPQWTQRTALFCLGTASVYWLGSTASAAYQAGPLGWLSLTSVSQFAPLLYVAAFITLNRGAPLLSWLHYLGLVLLFVVVVHSPWRAHEPDHVTYTWWLSVLLAFPCYIVGLQYISLLRERILASERAHQEAKESFLAMLSHEIRTPLQSMLGSIDLLAIKVRSDAEHRAVARLRESAAQLDAHLRDVTEFTRLESPAWRMREDQVNLLILCRDVVDALQTQAHSRQISLRLLWRAQPEAQDDEPPARTPDWARIVTDEVRLKQVLNNLLSNALKYTLEGSVTLTVIGPGQAQGRAAGLSLEVRDTGIGMPPESLPLIFQPYVRLEDSRVRREEGTGLGLAVVQLLTHRLGLKLSVESQPDQGTTFLLRWPVA